MTHPVHHEHRPHRKTRLILAAAFGGMILLMLAGGMNAIRILYKINEQSKQIEADALARAGQLASLRSNLLLSHAFVQDYLLDPDVSRMEEHRREFLQSWQKVQQELNSLAGTPDALQAQIAARLEQELDQYWSAISPSLAWTNQERQLEALTLYNSAVLPSRAIVLEITTDIDAAHSQQAAGSALQMAMVFEALRKELFSTLVLTLAAATLLAIASAVYILRLERETQARYQEVLAGRAEMEKLSERLVSAQEKERKAISRELHDEVGQSLNALLVDVGELQKRLPKADPRASDILDSIRRLANTSVNQIRDIALLLRPSMLDDLGLSAAIQWQGRELSRRSGLAVKVSTGGVSDDLPEPVRICFYRVAQEALQNAARHAEAKAVFVDLKQEKDRLLLSVRDDGVGFAGKTKGLGMMGMEERVRQIGGLLRVSSQPGKGTTVCAEVPVALSQLVPS